MEQNTIIHHDIVVKNFAHSGYRRAGVALERGENHFKAGDFTTSQLAMLQADKRLSVSLSNEQVQESTSSDGEEQRMADGELSADLTLLNAIAQLDPNNDEHYTKSGKPQTEALEALVDRSITAAERDQAWADYQAGLAEAEDPGAE